MRVLIADDEPLARRVLRELLQEFPWIRIVAEASTGTEAVERILEFEPDLALLDLRMPELDGLSAVKSLPGARMPLVIFVTAHERHALEAFDVGAVDYLLKPVRFERLQEALERARARLKPAQPPSDPRPRLRKIVGRSGAELLLFEPSDVIAFTAEGELVYVVTDSGRFLANHSLKYLESEVLPPVFRRIRRQVIVNTDHIRTISPLTSKRWLLKLSNGMEAIVSKRMAGAIREVVHT
jgi:DNA-binding LytR/AlgR family response regulator